METIAYTFCAYLPIHLLAYLPFLDLLRFGKFWMAATVAGNMVLHLLGVAWMISLGRPDLVMAVGLAMVPLSLALYFLNIRLAPGKLLFTYMLLVNYQSMAQGISAFCAVRLFHADARSLESGSSIANKRPFVRPAVNASRPAAEEAMAKVLDEEIEKIMT